MQGVMNALRVAVGRAPGGDRAGELLDMTGRADPVHLFDAYAMTNLRLCSAFRAGSTDSRGTRVMSSNCLRHFAATVRILEPTLCIVQGVEVARQVITLLTTAHVITANLHRGLLAGTRRCWRRSPIPPHGVISVGAVSPPCPICTTPSSPPLPLPASCVAHGPTPRSPTRPEPVAAASRCRCRHRPSLQHRPPDLPGLNRIPDRPPSKALRAAEHPLCPQPTRG